MIAPSEISDAEMAAAMEIAARHCDEQAARLSADPAAAVPWLERADRYRAAIRRVGKPRSSPPRVILESPYAGDVEANVAYGRRALADCYRRGEAAIASHLLHTQPGVLDDSIPAERNKGIAAGHAWMPVADLVAVYVDLGLSSGMDAAIRLARRLGVRLEERRL